MEIGAKRFLKSVGFRQIFLFWIILSCSGHLAAQDNSGEQQQDSVKTGSALGKLKFENPQSIISKYTYDPELDRYIYTESVGDFNINYPLILTPQQYFEFIKRDGIKSYFKGKIDALSGRSEDSEEARKNLLPNFYVNGGFFESIFGGNSIEVIPQGSIAVDLGVLFQRNDNPALSPRNRSNLSFDFDQRISLSLLGKVGERLQISANFDTEATFDFQNLVKLEYTPNEDDILRKIEIGNVSLPLNSSLISGAQSLFGVKTQLQFGRTTVTAVFSEQRSQNSSVTAQGGGTVNEFSVTPLDYDEDRHFFLAQFFRDSYDNALVDYPFIRSQVQITRLEVWVTNRNQQTLNVRNVVAIQDLGETDATRTRIGLQGGAPAGFFDPNATVAGVPRNSANDYDPNAIGSGGVLTDAVRSISTVESGFNIPGGFRANQGFDFAILENARQLEVNRDYQFNSQLGYISLNQRLSNDEVLGVAFQYTFNGEVFQVGEFANGGIDATTVDSTLDNPVVNNNTLILKMLKSNITNVQDPIWDLMMKNIYSTGAFQLQPEDFRLNILYSDPTPRNYLTPVVDFPDPTSGNVRLEDRILLDVFNFDRLNVYNDVQPRGDGFFDFIPGITIDQQGGRIVFTKVEPFGEFLFETLRSNPAEVYDVDNDQGYNPNQVQYVFRDLYAFTKAASLQEAQKNRFIISGRYKSEGRNGIPIGAFNVPRGSVRVTAGGRQLQEGIDFTVNYQAGTVQIIDPSLEASNTPIDISVENNAIFGQQTRRFTGFNVEHQFNENFVLGGTLLNLNERPLTQKANFGVEPVNNTIFGLNGNFSTEIPFLTRLVNKLPNIDTDVPSNLSIRAEAAILQPNSPNNADFRGETTTFLDDFEGAQALIDIRSSLGWNLASTPLEFAPGGVLAGTSPNDPANLINGFGRGKVAWYTIDPTFYTNQRPDGLTDTDISLNATRRVFIDEIFPETDIAQGQTLVQGTLDLAYYPDQKGPYNNNPDFDAEPAQDKWGGIMRSLSSTNFEQSNVEFIQFWLLDPFVDGDGTSTGELVINLGNISEDILRDGIKQYENGLPITEADLVTETSWGQVPSAQSLVYAFDADTANRAVQDVGLDGINDAAEAAIYDTNPGDDPALDNYTFFLDREGSILERYLDFNNTEGNSPVTVTQTDRGSTTLPDVEDIDRDLTTNTVNSYFEYRIPIRPGMDTNLPFVSDVRENDFPAGSPRIPDGNPRQSRWIQFKIPIIFDANRTEGEIQADPLQRRSIGGANDFRSISFMRMYVTDFTDDVVLRFGTLDLVRGDWRAFTNSLQPEVDVTAEDDGTITDVATVNIEENSDRTPIPYVLPPGVIREQLNNNNTIIRQNEQSLSFQVEGLESGDSRGVFKSLNADLRQYERIQMFMHAERIAQSDFFNVAEPLVGFFRMGTDFTDNFYQIEIPLQFTDFGATTAEEIWPSVNEMDVALEDLRQVKTLGIANQSLNELTFYEVIGGQIVEVAEFAPRTLGRPRIGIRGNPSLGSIRNMMVGVKNASDGFARGQVWFNELRLAGLDNNGGWAAVAAIDANIADFANFTATGNRSTSGFGTIDQIPNERLREDAISYDVVANVNVGQLFPKNWGIQLPFNYGISETLITPEFDPVFDDLRLQDRIDAAANPADAEAVRSQAEDYTKRRSINLIGVRKERGEDAKEDFFDIENFTFNYSFNETNHRDFEIEEATDQNVNAGFVYNYGFKPVTVAPFEKKDSLFTASYLRWLKEFNFNPLPTTLSVNANYIRALNEQRFREVFEPGVDALELPLLQQRNYQFNWQYALNYNLTRSLSFNVTASNNNIVRNFFNEPGNPDSGINENVGVYDGFFDIGEPNRHSQQFQLNYELPFSKLPFLGFINAQYSYTSNFDWQRGGDALQEVAGEDINTIQNANTHNLTANLSMQDFYDAIGLKKRDGNTFASRAPVRRDKAGNASEEAEEEKKPKKTGKAFNTLVDVLTMVKRVNLNYSENNGTVLPGYTRSVGFIGTTTPSLGFVFGSQADIRFEAARNGFLTTFPEFNTQFLQNRNRQLNITATAQPTPELTIDLSADRRLSNSFRETFRIEDAVDAQGNPIGEQVFQSLLGNNNGNFSITTNLIRTAFSNSDDENSSTFDALRNNRIVVANRLAEERGLPLGNPDTNEFPVGFGPTSQQVLIPSFFSAFSGREAERVNLDVFRQIPIPNWNIKFTGLSNIPWIKERFKRFSVSHAYQAAYSINSFQTNLVRTQLLNDGLSAINNENGDILPEDIIDNVVLNDAFNPLIRVDFETKSSFSFLGEVRRDRALSLSLNNNLLTEVNGSEYTFGLGYRIKDVKFVTNISGKKQRLKGDLNLKADVSLRNNLTIIRNLDIDNNQITAGQNLFSINFTADYALTKNLNALFFYDHSFSQFAVSTAFPQTSINTGFTVRYNFGN